MRTKKEIIDSLKSNPKLLREYHVRRIGIFGSYVTGNATDRSDVDILVDFSDAITLPQHVHLADSLSELLAVKADVVPLKGIKPYLKDRILNEVEWVEGL